MVFFAMVFAGMTAFAQQGGMAKADLAAAENEIREISKDWLNMARSHDIDGMVDLFAEDGIAYRPNSEPLVGHEAIKQHLMKEKESNPKEVANWSTEKVDVAASGDLAVEYGKYSSTNAGPDGKGSDNGNYITVFRKIDGKWKVVADIGSSSKPSGSEVQ